MKSNGKDTASIVLLGLSLVGGIVEFFWRPLGIALVVLITTLVGTTISNKYKRLGMITVAVITIGFIVGGSIAMYYDRPLY